MITEHVVDYVQSGHPDGFVAVMVSHQPELPDWTDDGLTCGPGIPCSAIADATNRRCAKNAVVVLMARAKYTRAGSGSQDVWLCGGHYAVHRAGLRTVRVLVTPGKAT